jgi:hypothetical protein
VLFMPVEANTSWEPIAVSVTDRKPEKRKELFVDDRLDPRMAPHVVRAAPFEVAEILAPLGARPIEKRRPTVYIVCLGVGRDFRPGRYEGFVRVRAGRESVEIPVTLRVGTAMVPARRKLQVTNWFLLDNIAKSHGQKMWSPGFWAMLRKYARLMAEYRQNVFWVPLEVFLVKSRSLKPTFDWPRFDRYVRLFLREGFQRIECCHFAARRVAAQPEEGAYVVLGTAVDLFSLEGRRWVDTVARELWAHVRRRRWDSIFLQHVADEPHPAEAECYLRVANMLRQAMPGVKLIDAILGTPAVQGALDVHVPNVADLAIPGVEREAEFDRLWQADRFRQLAEITGGEFWSYSCCGPRGPALNRFLDFPLIRTRLLHWLNFRQGATGYLHWGLNMWLRGQPPFRKAVNPISRKCHCRLPPGDTHIVWPGDDGPWPSLRLEAMRDGILDYELLHSQASQAGGGRSRGDKLARRIVRSVVNYCGDIAEFRKVYRTLVKA